MGQPITWVGVDAHKKTLAIAVLWPDRQQPEEWSIENTEGAVAKLVRRLERQSKGAEIRACYEAGTCGYTLQRRFHTAGQVVCEVIAPSLIPRKPGDHIKTDRRDARKLAELNRAGLLTTVAPPTLEEEALRDLCRCREDVRSDLGRCRHRLVKMLVRRGYVFNSTSRLWSEAHRRWLASLEFANPVDRFVLSEYQLAVLQAEQRLRALDAEIAKAAELPLYRDQVARLRCFRGIDTTTAMIFLAELHGIERFESPRQLAAYLGLVPSVYSSADKAHRGSITKAGNRHIRRVLVQTSWQYRHRPGVGPKLRARREGQPGRVLTIADNAQRRLCTRYRRLTERGKTPNKVVIAIARELLGFLWAALKEPAPIVATPILRTDQPPKAPRAKALSGPEAGQRRKARKEKRAN
jgi:transposase